MDKRSLNGIEQGFQTAFVDYTIESNLAYKPMFLSNDNKKGQKLLSVLDEELMSCDEFTISVAFITMGGITPLLQTLKDLEKKNVKGRILTTDYLLFSEPKALEVLNALENIELRFFQTEEEIGFHTKGYLFKRKDLFHIIVGSSNMTQKALTVNKEWNTKVISTGQGELFRSITGEFNTLWDCEATVPYSAIAKEYEIRYNIAKKQRQIAIAGQIISLDEYKLEPNSMQVGFIQSLEKLHDDGKDRALLISATGTGKTYASAFGVRDVLISGSNKRVLFLVHREQIAKQALSTFRRVFGNSKKYGLLSGTSKDYDAQFLFATMQMMAKEETLARYDRKAFSCIILDEYDIIGLSREAA